MSQLEQPITGVAIIGLAGRFPKAPKVETFWENLCAGHEAITFFTEEELAITGAAQPLKDPRYVKARGILPDADLFDAAFFGINPKEAEILDPQHRIFLETAWEALERAGYDPEREPGLIGVFAGMSMNTYLPMNLLARPGLAELVGSYALMLANDKDYLPTRVSYKLNLRGPSVNVQTGCSSSLVAVAMACQQLLNYQCDLALAGGVSVSFPQKRGHLFQEGSIYSPDGHCRTFDAAASGTVGGEGVGIVVLKRAAEAVADGDEIWGIIKGFAINNDGAAKAGYTAPSESGQAECIALAQAMAGVTPDTIGYLEAHGTGTPLGDPIEVAGLTRAFRAGTTARQFCALGSVKTHIGHLDAAAGIAGLITATLALRHKKLPPCLHYQQPNPKIDFANSPFYVNARLRDWPAHGTPRRAGVSSFGIGGTNAHVVLEEAPPQTAAAAQRPAHLLVISAKTESALEAATANLAEHLRRYPETNLADVAYTLQIGRREFRHRRAVVCRDLTGAVEGLQVEDIRRLGGGTQAAEEARAVFLFPGQGAQRIHMARELYEHEPLFRRHLEECAELLQPHLGRDIREILYPDPGREEWAREQLTQTQWTQPALFIVEYALARLWMNWGVHPAALIGHSLGEYTAACLAGVLNLEEALRLVALRGRLMQEQPAGTMIAARLPEAEAASYANDHLAIAAVNSPNLCVFSGATSAIEALRQQLTSRGVVTHRLETSHAFHSPMMEPVRRQIVEAARQARLCPPRIPYLSNVTGDWITPAEATDPEYYGRHLRQTVRFADGVGKLLGSDATILIEVGPGQTLSTFARQHPDFQADRLVLTSLHHAQAGHTDTSVLLQALGQAWAAGAPVNWKALHANEPRRRVVLPTYPFERRRFFVDPAPQFLFMAAATPEQEATMTAATASDQSQSEQATPASPQAQPIEDLLARLQQSWSALSGLELSSLDADKTFAELGMDSLFLSQASLMLEKEFNVRVPFEELLHKFPTLRQLAGRLESTKHHTPQAVPVAVESQKIPLTAAQKEIWFAVQRGDAAATAFNHGVTFRLEGPLDVPVLCRSLQALTDRHEALRLTFASDGETQRVCDAMPARVSVVDYSSLSSSARNEQMDHALAVAAREPFDLAQGPVWRAQVIKLGPASHVFQFVVHHLACDGGSLGVLLQELAEFYTAGTQGAPLPANSPQPFSEFAWAQHQSANSPACARTESYWLLQYSQPLAPLELPKDRPRPARLGYAGASASLRLGKELTEALKRLSAAESCTLFTTLLSGFAVLLGRLSRQTDIAIGVPITRRTGVGSDRLVGHCVNFLPLRLPVNREHTLQDQLRITREAVRGLQEHADYTLGSLLQKLKRPRDPSRPSLVSVMFNLDWVRSPLRLPGVEATLLPGDALGVPFELSFNLAEWDHELHCLAHYHTELFNVETVTGWLAQYRNILTSLAEGALEWIGEDKAATQVAQAPVISGANPEETLTRADKPAPINPIEVALAQMWREVIGVPTVSRHDDFFDLGGHSVLLTQVITRVRKNFGVELTLAQLFEAPTVASLAEVIEGLVLQQLENMSEAEAERQAAKLEPASKE